MPLLKVIFTLLISFSFFSVFFLLNQPSFDRVGADLFLDIYDRADQESQSSFVSLFHKQCLFLPSQPAFKNLLRDCDNATYRALLQSTCDNYEESRKIGFSKIDDLDRVCPPFLNGEFDRSCALIRELANLNLTSLSSVCSSYKSGELDNRTFFTQAIASMIPDDPHSSPYFRWMNLMKWSSLISALLLLPLLFFFYFVMYNDLRSYLRALGTPFLTFGSCILFFYVISTAILVFIGDTSHLLFDLVNWNTLSSSVQQRSLGVLSLFVLRSFFGQFFSLLFAAVAVVVGLVLKRIGKEKTPL